MKIDYFKEIKTRVLWLLIGLLLSLGIAQVIKGFEGTLQDNLILASFIPLVVYMSDAVGTQMEAIIIRRLNSKGRFSFIKFFRQQALIVVTVALVIGAVAGVVTGVVDHSRELGLVIGLSLFFGILSSLATGTVLPYLFWKLHDDPAEASGPVATVIQDFFSILIFFLFAQTLL